MRPVGVGVDAVAEGVGRGHRLLVEDAAVDGGHHEGAQLRVAHGIGAEMQLHVVGGHEALLAVEPDLLRAGRRHLAAIAERAGTQHEACVVAGELSRRRDVGLRDLRAEGARSDAHRRRRREREGLTITGARYARERARRGDRVEITREREGHLRAEDLDAVELLHEARDDGPLAGVGHRLELRRIDDVLPQLVGPGDAAQGAPRRVLGGLALRLALRRGLHVEPGEAREARAFVAMDDRRDHRGDLRGGR